MANIVVQKNNKSSDAKESKKDDSKESKGNKGEKGHDRACDNPGKAKDHNPHCNESEGNTSDVLGGTSTELSPSQNFMSKANAGVGLGVILGVAIIGSGLFSIIHKRKLQ